MRLVHQAKDDIGSVLILGGDLRPNVGKLVVGGPALPNDLPVPSSIVVNVNDARRPGREARLYQLIIIPKVCGI